MINLLVQKSDYRPARWRLRYISGMVSRRILRACFSALIAGGLVFSVSPNVSSQNPQDSEYAVKLAFLYNFTKFIEWPSSAFRNPDAPLVICIVGRDPFRPDLEAALRTRKVGDHLVVVRILTANDEPAACHVIFVPVTEKHQADRILRGLPASGILTIGETDGFAVMGGIINLTVEANKVHFEINRTAADRAGLKIGSKLLSIAKIVHDQSYPKAT
jgi:hypothetical protein